MKKPSKKVFRIEQLHKQRDDLHENLKLTARDPNVTPLDLKKIADDLVKTEQDIVSAEAAPDQYTCCMCQQDFSPGNHTDICVVAVNFYDDPLPVTMMDFGSRDLRRLILCETCFPQDKKTYLKTYLFER